MPTAQQYGNREDGLLAECASSSKKKRGTMNWQLTAPWSLYPCFKLRLIQELFVDIYKLLSVHVILPKKRKKAGETE